MKKLEWVPIIRQRSLKGDPIFDAFVVAWHNLTDDQRSRFVDEGVDALLYFDRKGRLLPGWGFTDE